MTVNIIYCIKNMMEDWKNYQIDYYMNAFRQCGMFDNEANSQVHDTKITLSKNESMGNVALSSPFWNSEAMYKQPHSDKIYDILRPHPLGNQIWNWAAFFFGPFWTIGRCGFIFILDFLLFIMFASVAYVAMKIGSGEISLFMQLCMLSLFPIYIILHGYFGNYVYSFIVKRDVETGLHIITRYFSALHLVDYAEYDKYFLTLSKRAKKRHPQRLIISKKNVRHYLKICTCINAEHLKLTIALFPV